ncbi:MAG: MBL fold metallo-hydrolase [Deltaproteobacteria bacterium]|jgi:glyoxylase-like metal-dependent hydrolase (beta-lactamase superfamily II)|nr:MBL fold metallo-hydrolase [Deltaproteobacteria bacterium]
MYEELSPGIFRIETPLPGSPLRALNAYLALGRERGLLIDSGFNHPQTAEALFSSLDALKVDLTRLDFLVTHIHSDHSGLSWTLAQKSPQSKVMMGKNDGERLMSYLRDKKSWNDRVFAEALRRGFSEDELKTLTHPGIVNSADGLLNLTYIHDGGVLSYPPHSFTVMEVPGHTPGLITLYEQHTRIYISADHILGDITPNITAWDGIRDSLGDYLRSLDKISRLDIARSLPGHRRVIEDTAGRILELKRHHAARLEEARGIIVRHGPLSAYDAASHMTWSMRGRDWSEYPVSQKNFAASEAAAHLDHLVCNGALEREELKDKTVYRLKKS